MASFYGNIKNNSRSSFIFDRIYTSRCEMEKALYEVKDDNGVVAGDGVFINRYVLINYGYSAKGIYTLIKRSQVNESNYSQYYYIVDESNHNEYYDELTKKYYLPGNVYAKNNDVRQWENEAENTLDYYQKTNFINRFDINLKENSYYADNREADAEKYYASYDHTVWQKIYSDNKEKYILVAELDAAAPTFELITDAPYEMGGSPHFDLSLSSDLNYVYHVPKNWDIILNEYNPNILTEEIEEQISNLKPENFHSNDDYDLAVQNIENHPEQLESYWYYENDLFDKDKTFNIKEDYPFINKKGFDKTTHVIKPVQEEGIKLIETKSTMKYTIHQYRAIALTKDTYTKKRYYTVSTTTPPRLIDDPDTHIFTIENTYFIALLENPTYYIVCPLEKNIKKNSYTPSLKREAENNEAYWYTPDIDHAFELSLDDFDSTKQYYELTTICDEDNNRIREHKKDTKRLDIFLPSIGNAIATMYDAIYGKPRYASRRIIGYTNKENFNYEQNDYGAYEIQTSQYTLTDEEVNNLRIPIYLKADGSLSGYILYSDLDKFETNSSGSYMILGQIYEIKHAYKNEQIINESDNNTWDIPVYQLVDNIIGYTTENIVDTYTSNEDGQYIVNGNAYDLTQDDIDELSPEMIPGIYDVPVYAKENKNARPYDDAKLFGAFAPPYDNINEEDNISMGWALDTLKKYISELRYLANGQNGSVGNSLGLQSDWTLDDDQSFGYIYHKPDIITSFIPSTDQSFITGKTYYIKKIDNISESDNFGYEYYEEVNDSTINVGDSPSSLNYYEIPKTMAKNAETEFYRREDVVGFVSSSDIQMFDKLELCNKYYQKVENTNNPDMVYYKKTENNFIIEENEFDPSTIYYIKIELTDNKYLQKTNTTNDSEKVYYKKEANDFIVEEDEFDSSTTYYTEVIDKNQIFTINSNYYLITNDQINNLQKYSDGKKTYEVIKFEGTTSFIPTESYFINNGSRYIPAYKTIGTYTFQPITQEQYGENCLCYFNKFQEIKVEKNAGYLSAEDDLSSFEQIETCDEYYQKVQDTSNSDIIYYKNENGSFIEENELDPSIIYYKKIELTNHKYLRKIIDLTNSTIIYYKKENDSFVEEEFDDIDSNIQYYTEVKQKSHNLFIINQQYYFITDEQLDNINKEENSTYNIPIERVNSIIERKYRFESMGDFNNIYLTTGNFHNGNLENGDLDDKTEFNNKRIKKFYITINEDEELEMTDEFAILSIENMTRRQLIDYLLDKELEHIGLPLASYEIIEVFNEDYQIYRNRNNNAFDFNQYVVSIKQEPLDKNYWEQNRNKGITYYLREYKPIAQIDYEINTIWNSIKVND